MAAQDRLTATEQPKTSSGLFRKEPPQPNSAPVTDQPSAPVQLFGSRKDQPLKAICDKNLSSDAALSFGALTKSTQLFGERPESNNHIGGMLAQNCIRGDVITYFLDTWGVTLANWMLLLHKTALPEDGIDNAQQMSTAVNALESVIAGQELIPAKFSYLQLANFLDALESRIQLQKDNGEERKGRSAATIAFDQYLALQGLQGKKHGKDACPTSGN
ncbi:hypothetical protein BBAD15_g11820 [Beauveria bassiana D1-5]|uniref:Uncharacterized protein n=1 Tax=Beauveria bassiana D1-5 TaxID=1245745 RepID=A0A0A2VQ60_BEABA|nr:hypothetical protein BBAD15_g11820 [Beauveria bassiana D1-5]